MNYSINYFKPSTYAVREGDEIIIKYSEKSTGLIDFVNRHPNQKVIADITGLDNPEDSLSIFSASGISAIKLSLSQKSILPDLREDNIPYFFMEHCGTWDRLIYQLKLGASEVYIVNELGFDLPSVRAACKKYNAKIRCYCNVAQHSAPESSLNEVQNLKSFFIRPEAVVVYEPLVDTLEFFGDDLGRQDILLKIYEGKKWNDSLDLLILGLKTQTNSNMIPQAFDERRTLCRKSCYYSPTCHMCERTLELGAALQENGLALDLDKADTENTILNNYLKELRLYEPKEVDEDYRDDG